MRLLRMIIECATPLKCGGGQPDPVLDQPVSRDAFGLWRIPGTSLAGALRALAHKISPSMAESLFGSTGGERPAPSKIWCEDGLLLDFDNKPALYKTLAAEEVKIKTDLFVRDHVRLSLTSGTALEGGKFDSELVPAGARFLLEFRCDGWNRPLEGEETEFFDRLCEMVLDRRLPLGGGRSNGYGHYRVVAFSYVELDLMSEKGQEWLLNLPRGLPLPAEIPAIPLNPESAPPQGPGLCGEIAFTLEGAGPIIIGGGQAVEPDGKESFADIIFARTPVIDYDKERIGYEYILPSTSLKGVLRHAIYDILLARGAEKARAEAILNGIFGYVDGEASASGKIGIEDSRLASSHTAVVEHVCLDRFSGGVMPGALFDEEPVWAPQIKAPFKLLLNGLDSGEAALFFHALLDLFEGRLAFGNGVNRGNGRLRLPGWQEKLEARVEWNGMPLSLSADDEDLRSALRQWDAGLKEVINA